MKDTYKAALARVLVHEGGKVDDPADPGGRTNQGVTQRVYAAWRARNAPPPRDVWTMEPAERDAIYRVQYWDAVKGDQLPAGVDYAVFDGAVNSGPAQSIKWLQRALGVPADGVIGQATLAAVEACPDHDLLVAAICERRMAFLRALRTFSRFGRGWTARVDAVRKGGQGWATGSVPVAAIYQPGGERKALLADARKPPVKGVADALQGGGVSTAGLSQVTDALTPLSDSVPQVRTLLTILTAVGAAALIAGMAWRWWATRHAAALADALDTAPPSPVPPAVAPAAAA